MASEPVTVTHSCGSYPVQFVDFARAMAALPANCVFVTDENVSAHWGASFPAGVSVHTVPPGESSKSLGRFASLVEALALEGRDRATSVVAVGGGVVGDLAGFVASTYMRGVPYIQVPTSLLAQVDSSVGGKVAVDTPEGKNLIGAFYPPKAVYVAAETLRTLPEREFVNGMAEVCKYGFILDRSLAEQLGGAKLGRDSDRLGSVVKRCIELKARIVQEDEFDRTGKRAVLNFGHTVGHAVEHVTGYGPVLHGEAVAIGMVVEARLGERLGVTEKGVAEEVARGLALQGLPIGHECLNRPEPLLQAMWRDKKVQDGELAFSLLTRLGESKLVTGIQADAVTSALMQR